MQGEILINIQKWDYLLAVLQGEKQPEVSEYSADRGNCEQHEWLTEVEEEIRKHIRKCPDDYVENKNGNGYQKLNSYFGAERPLKNVTD